MRYVPGPMLVKLYEPSAAVVVVASIVPLLPRSSPMTNPGPGGSDGSRTPSPFGSRNATPRAEERRNEPKSRPPRMSRPLVGTTSGGFGVVWNQPAGVATRTRNAPPGGREAVGAGSVRLRGVDHLAGAGVDELHYLADQAQVAGFAGAVAVHVLEHRPAEDDVLEDAEVAASELVSRGEGNVGRIDGRL